MIHFHRLERLRQARDFARMARRTVHRSIGEAIDVAGDRGELVAAADDLDGAIERLERILRLTDPAAGGLLTRRADEDRIPAGS